MRIITLPVVAHRIYGIGREPSTVWESKATMSKGPPFASAVAVFGKAWNSPISELFEETAMWGKRDNAGAGLSTASKIFVEPTPGTRRTIDEIRDIFDSDGRAATTGEENINKIWGPAGITFRLVSVVDHAICTHQARAIPYDEVGHIVRRRNHLDLLNMYFFRNIIGADGVAYFSAFPDDPSKNTGYATVTDFEEFAYYPWRRFIETLAHEIGHFLALPHEESIENLMYPYATNFENRELRPIQIIVARDCASRYEAFTRRLRVVSSKFRNIIDDPEAPPMHSRVYRGEVWRFDYSNDNGR
jgi:hypothetical protein